MKTLFIVLTLVTSFNVMASGQIGESQSVDCAAGVQAGRFQEQTPVVGDAVRSEAAESQTESR